MTDKEAFEACPRGARGAVFEYWNEARKLLSD